MDPVRITGPGVAPDLAPDIACDLGEEKASLLVLANARPHAPVKESLHSLLVECLARAKVAFRIHR